MPRIPALLCVLLIPPVATSADVVHLANGDRLTGKIVTKRGDILVFEAAHAGKVRLPWREVAAIVTAAPVPLMLRGESGVRQERLAAAPDGGLRLGSGETVALRDVEHLRPGPEQSGIGTAYSGRANVALSDSRGNSEGRRIYAEGELTARSRDRRYTLAAKVERQHDSGVRTASNWRADGNHDWFIDPKFFRYARGSLEHDGPKDIDLRSTAGGGYGLQIFDNAQTSLSLRGGLDYVVIDRVAGGEESYPALGWGLRAAHRPGGGELELFHDQDGFLRLTEGNGVILRSRTGLRAPLGDGLTASLQLNLDWEEKPAPGRAATDSRLLAGLGYAW